MKKFFVYTLILFAFWSCKKDDVVPTAPENEEELITTVRIALVDVDNSTDSTVYYWQDAAHISDAKKDTIEVVDGKTYAMFVWVLNEENPADVEDITEEVREEAAEHQFFFGGTAVSMGHLKITYEDMDENNMPVGLWNNVEVSTPMQDMKLRVVLRHEPNKNAPEVASGNITNAGGETDIDVEFVVDVL